MRIVVALDSFKDALGARDACVAVAEGLRDVDPDIDVVLKPMADGGEGTAAALLGARTDGEWIPRTVAGPLPGQRVPAGFGWLANDRTAIVEMASASGLGLVAPEARNPWITTTFGTGELLWAAATRGARRILLAVGGSATHDCGIGAAAALGWRFLDVNGQTLSPEGGQLRAIARIQPPEPGQVLPPILVLCDVTHTLCGPQGAAAVFAPQKGATPAMVEALDVGSAHLAGLIREATGHDIRNLPGGGAAGGLAAGAVAFLGAELVPGVQTVLAATGLRQALEAADWCITGEGSLDETSTRGKVVSGIVAAAGSAGVPCVVFAGQVQGRPDRWQAFGIHEVRALRPPGISVAESRARTAELLRRTAADWLRDTG